MKSLKPTRVPLHVTDPNFVLDLIALKFARKKIMFSKTTAAKIVGGEYRLERLVEQGEIDVDKPTAKQNGKWFCDGSDVIRHIKF